MKTISHCFSKLAPIEVRLLARWEGKWMTSRTIAKHSGLPVSAVRRISELTSWDNVTIREASLFCQACGVDLLHPRRSIDYINRRSFAHLKCNPRYRDKLVGILRDFRNSQQS